MEYDQDIPDELCGPSRPEVKVISREVAKHFSKREVVEYLRAAAPRIVLIKYGLVFSVKNAVKAICFEDLLNAVDETLSLRSADGDSTVGSAGAHTALSSGSACRFVMHEYDVDSDDSVEVQFVGRVVKSLTLAAPLPPGLVQVAPLVEDSAVAEKTDGNLPARQVRLCGGVLAGLQELKEDFILFLLHVYFREL